MTERPKILFLAHLLPWPLDGGGQIKSYHTLRLLAEQYDITLFALIRREDERKNTEALQPFCAGGVHCFDLRRSRASNPVNAVRALLQNTSFIVSRDDVSAVREAIQAELVKVTYAAIHIDHLQMAQFVPSRDSLEKPITVILDQHNVEHRIPKRLAETPGASPATRWYAGIEWPKLRDFEIAAMRSADITLTVSDEDRDAFLELAPDLQGKIATVPIGVDTDYFAVASRRPEADSLLSIGTMYWPPNVDAIVWFCNEVLPLLKQQRPDCRVLIVGAKPTPEIVALGTRDSNVIVTGTVPDVRPYAEDCGAFIVPLRSGSGMRVKILNALSMGLPVVSTTVGAEGIEVTMGTNIFLADTQQDFANAILLLLNDKAVADRIGANGRALMEEKYSWNAVGKQLHAVYARVVGEHRA